MEIRYKFRIYPTPAQEIKIQKNFGCVRFVYNHFLSERIKRYEAGEGIYCYNDASRDLTALKRTPGYEWLREADAHSLQKALKNMNYAYSEFFRRMRQKDGAPGFPKYKSKRETHQSYTSQAQTGKCVIDVRGKQILLPKLGLVECRVSRQIRGRILSAAVMQVPSGKYYVSVCCTDFEPEQLPQTGAYIGLHFGIRTLAVSSDGQVIENNRYMEKAQKKISRLRKRLSRKSSGSVNREKARIALAKAYERVSNQKADTLQKLTTQFVRDYDVICVRDDNLTKMMKDRPFAAYLSDASWGELVRLLQYKCGWYGKELLKVDPSYPSVQFCSSCGYQNNELAKKASREWTCPKCGVSHERARNAAANTLKEGLRVSRAS